MAPQKVWRKSVVKESHTAEAGKAALQDGSREAAWEACVQIDESAKQFKVDMAGWAMDDDDLDEWCSWFEAHLERMAGHTASGASSKPLTAKEINFAENQLTVVGMSRLLETFMENGIIVLILKLHHNRVNGAGNLSMFLAACQGNLRELHLSHNELDTSAAAEIMIATAAVRDAQGTPCYPQPLKGVGGSAPFWLRLEQNFLDHKLLTAQIEPAFAELRRAGRLLCSINGRGCTPRCCMKHRDEPPAVHVKFLANQRPRPANMSAEKALNFADMHEPFALPAATAPSKNSATVQPAKGQGRGGAEAVLGAVAARVWRVKEKPAAKAEAWPDKAKPAALRKDADKTSSADAAPSVREASASTQGLPVHDNPRWRVKPSQECKQEAVTAAAEPSGEKTTAEVERVSEPTPSATEAETQVAQEDPDCADKLLEQTPEFTEREAKEQAQAFAESVESELPVVVELEKEEEAASAHPVKEEVLADMDPAKQETPASAKVAKEGLANDEVQAHENAALSEGETRSSGEPAQEGSCSQSSHSGPDHVQEALVISPETPEGSEQALGSQPVADLMIDEDRDNILSQAGIEQAPQLENEKHVAGSTKSPPSPSPPFASDLQLTETTLEQPEELWKSIMYADENPSRKGRPLNNSSLNPEAAEFIPGQKFATGSKASMASQRVKAKASGFILNPEAPEFTPSKMPMPRAKAKTQAKAQAINLQLSIARDSALSTIDKPKAQLCTKPDRPKPSMPPRTVEETARDMLSAASAARAAQMRCPRNPGRVLLDDLSDDGLKNASLNPRSAGEDAPKALTETPRPLAPRHGLDAAWCAPLRVLLNWLQQPSGFFLRTFSELDVTPFVHSRRRVMRHMFVIALSSLLLRLMLRTALKRHK